MGQTRRIQCTHLLVCIFSRVSRTLPIFCVGSIPAHLRHSDGGAEVAALLPVYNSIMLPELSPAVHADNGKILRWRSYGEVLRPFLRNGNSIETLAGDSLVLDGDSHVLDGDSHDGDGLIGGFLCVQRTSTCYIELSCGKALIRRIERNVYQGRAVPWMFNSTPGDCKGERACTPLYSSALVVRSCPHPV